MTTTAKVIAATPFSKGSQGEYPIRFAVAKYKAGTNPHPYVTGMQVKRGVGHIDLISTSHYFTESDAMNNMLFLIARHNEGHKETWISYIPPTVKKVK